MRISTDGRNQNDPKIYELWKFYFEDGEKVKDRLWSISLWLYALLSGILAYSFENISELKKIDASFQIEFILPSVVGVMLSLYASWMITIYGLHIRTSWQRTEFLRNKSTLLKTSWDSAEKYFEDSGSGVPEFVKKIRLFYVGFGMLFIAHGIYVYSTS